MRNVDELIRFEQANSGLAFREHLYSPEKVASLIRDVLSLANANVVGPRLLLLGVRDLVGGERVVVGVARPDLLQFRKSLPEILARAIEPVPTVEVSEARIDGKLVGVVTLSDCGDPPYLVNKAIGRWLPAGIGFVRRGSRTLSLGRADLKAMFRHTGDEPLPNQPLRLAFKTGKNICDELTLNVLPVVELPSQRAASRLRAMIDAKQSSRAVLGRTETQFSRLVFARVYGAETPFEAHTDESLMLRLAQAPEDYRAADEFYQYELLAHKIQLTVINDGSSELHNVRIHVRLQRIDGAGLSDRIYLENGDDPATGEYPKITAMDRRFSIEADFPSLGPGSSGNLFATEPRLWVREAAGGKSIVVDYSVEADELASAVRDSLIIHICALDPTA